MADQQHQDGQQQQQQQQQQQAPAQQQQQQQQHPDLNFSIQDILGDHGANNASFPIVQHNPTGNGGGSEDGSQYAHLPAELQHIFSNNGIDDLSAADPAVQQHVQEILWNSNMNKDQQQQQKPLNVVSPSSSSQQSTTTTTTIATPTTSMNAIPTPSQAHIQAATQWLMPTSAPMSVPPPQQQQHPQSIVSHTPTPPLIPQQHTPQSQPQQQHPPSQPQPGSKTTTLLENIISQLSPERKEDFLGLFRQLQTNSVSPEQFYIRAKSMLGQQQYQQLEDLKNKPGPQDGKDTDKKRAAAAGPSQQNNAHMAGLVTPQMKRAKTEHNNNNNNSNNNNIPPGMPMGPPLSTPMNPAMFKQQAPVQNIAGLQIPRAGGPTALPGQATTTTTTAPAKPSTSTPAPGQAASGDRIDYDTLTDVMGYAGVDLREEEQHFMKDGEMTGGVLPDGVDRSKTQEFMNPELLKERVLELAKPFALGKLDSDFVSYLALATQERLRGLVEHMVVASKHRTMSQHVSAPPPVDENGHPLYKVIVQQDTKKQLLAIERAEREEEQKRKEAVADRERRSQMGKDGAGGEEGRSKSKKKDKESAQQRGGAGGLNDGLNKSGSVASETALMKAIGGVRKSWMLAGNARDQQAGAAPGGTGSQQAATASSGGDTSAPGTPGAGGGGGDDSGRGRGRPRGRKAGDAKRGRGRGRDVGGLFLPPSTIGRHRLGDPASRKITVRDALFALERDFQAAGRGGGQRTLLKTYNQWLK
ncbi:transcription initiation factor TFIID component TAF4 family-domain-containing protein [Zychaea mexicana]|uniref:transcription initiation factor TFIID component TAF4 family-domain-containing protein n=1 Tax=Zychaea mexicana TaxID=64656 RepID=UPI0022FDCAEB|nr:transcription initiation factor TFIID component TAF4 family-domain-containing protein [Zychaea mexicana]KAI9496379.1 transcription initiation factor TFIID component TAF4 family-domain-containing protein [Zychaea mexicana]